MRRACLMGLLAISVLPALAGDNGGFTVTLQDAAHLRGGRVLGCWMDSEGRVSVMLAHKTGKDGPDRF